LTKHKKALVLLICYLAGMSIKHNMLHISLTVLAWSWGCCSAPDFGL